MMLSGVWRLSIWRLSVCLSVAYIGPKSTTERRKIKIGTEVADVTWDSDTTFEVKSSKIKVTWAGAYCGRLPHSLLKLFSATVIVAIILQWIITTVLRWGELPWRRVVLLKYPSSFYYGRTLSERPCYILPMFLSFFMSALVGQTAERIFTKLSHVVDIRHHLW